MNGASSPRPLVLASCILLIVAGGCADLGEAPSWLPFQSEAPSSLPGVPSPRERIAQLRELAARAASSDPGQRAAVAAELGRTISQEEDPLIRAEIVRALGDYPGPAADAALRPAVNDPDAEVRQAACEAWGKRGGAEAATVLAGVLGGDVNVDVRLAAARALGHVKDPQAVAALGEVLEDKDPAMQYRAVKSLRQITGEDFNNDVNRWRQYVQSGLPQPAQPVTLADRLRGLF
jgi:HEAT repeat protein